jgi:predicted restriction endonuclease
LDKAFPTDGNWTTEQTKLAFYFYCQTPFGQLHGRNPKVKALAKLIRRTPDALAMKCCNIASIDPAIKTSGRSGLGNASSLDKQIWQQFHADWDGLADNCEQLLSLLQGEPETASQDPLSNELALLRDFTGETKQALVKLRVKQTFFRKAVLSGYHHRCCITGLADTRFLIASHIVPWREDASIRLHPGNGLCLSALHDKAFDNYLFSLTDDYRILLSTQLEKTKDAYLQNTFWPLQDKTIELPERFQPEVAFVQRHRAVMLAQT